MDTPHVVPWWLIITIIKKPIKLTSHRVSRDSINLFLNDSYLFTIKNVKHIMIFYQNIIGT